MQFTRIGKILFPLTLILWLACSSATPPAILAGLGERCDGTTEATGCDLGLVCAHDGTCQDPDDPGASGVAGPGEDCGASQHCRFGLVCTSGGVCGDPGAGGVDDACLGAEDCLAELVCAGDGSCQDPDDPGASGVAGLGEQCADPADCQLGLICFIDGTCQAAELWLGADCARSDEEEQDSQVPFKVYFEVPGRETVHEFYRLPFPNDIRMKNGRVDLSGHPAPDTPLAGGLVRNYLDAIQDEADGFSTQAAVFVRFSKRVDFDSLDLTGQDPNLLMVDITPDSPNYGWGPGVSMYTTTMRGKYICQNWLSMKPLDGYPLRHATTYAVILTAGITSTEGSPLERDDDFAAMLSSSEPGDGSMRSAWQAYQPLRDYLADDTVVDPGFGDRVMAASVFTTMDPDRVMEGFRDKIRDCSGSDCGLLPDALPRGLSVDSSGSGYHVLKGALAVPVFQSGTAPYLEEGGAIEFSGGQPVIQRSEEVNFSLSVPEGVPPADGWPVVIFAHGTGGGPDSLVDNGVAGTLASVDVTLEGAAQTVKLAVIGIQGVQHGERRGDTELGPDVLYFNFLNPYAAKYNAVQGAADNFQLVQMIEALDSSPASVAGLDHPVKLDADRICYFGHSQGSLTGPLFLAYEPRVNTVVLSGAGGNLIQSLLTKTRPVDIAGATRLVLNDVDVGALHPMLNLLQLYFDPIDTVNYAGAMTRSPVVVGQTPDDPPEDILGGPHHVFMSFGRDDHYSTESTLISMARPLGVRQVGGADLTCNCHEDCDTVSGSDELHTGLCRIRGTGEATVPARGTDYWEGAHYTAVLKMYLPDGTDGHFVLFEHPEGPGDYAGFLGSAAVDPEGVPTFFP